MDQLDGVTGFPEAIEAVYPHAKIQLFLVHLVRNSLKYMSWKDRKALCQDLKKVYGAKTVLETEMALKNVLSDVGRQIPLNWTPSEQTMGADHPFL